MDEMHMPEVSQRKVVKTSHHKGVSVYASVGIQVVPVQEEAVCVVEVFSRGLTQRP